MPLPTPRSVISSPIHMIRPVPAVIVRIISSSVLIESSGMTGTWHPGKSVSELAIVMIVVACRIASPMVRYRVYWVSTAVPDCPSLCSSSNRGITTRSSCTMMLAVM